MLFAHVCDMITPRYFFSLISKNAYETLRRVVVVVVVVVDISLRQNENMKVTGREEITV